MVWTLKPTADLLIEKVTKCLRKHSTRTGGARLVTYSTLPLLTDEEFEGTPLRHLMVPKVPQTGVESEQLFDVWMWPHTSGEGISVDDLSEHDKALVEHVGDGDFGVQTVRLLHALSTAKGARLEWDDNAIMVIHGEQAFGIIDGVVRSRFCTGTKIDVDHREVLTGTRVVRTTEPHFTSLYKEAMRVDKELTKVLVALTMRHGFSFKEMAEAAKQPPSDAQLKRWSRTLCEVEDPLLRLYKQLVPRWMDVSEFAKVFNNLGTRPTRLTPATQQVYINRLYMHFS